MTAAPILAWTLGLYVAAGLCAAIAFVILGVGRVLPQPESSAPVTFTLGARLLIIPGAVALWPYVLARWLQAEVRR
jgi:hypothetical protein